MMAAIRSEFRKLLTVRATYIILALASALTVFIAFYIEGYHRKVGVTDPNFMASEVTSAAQALALFISFAGLLLVTNEYRYNTIAYTLTAARSRTQVILAKTIAISVFAVVALSLLCLAAPYLALLGVHARGLSIVDQNLPLVSLLTRAAFYGWGYSMIVMIAAWIVRSQVGTLAFIILFPSVIENLLTLLMKTNVKYLPFTALGQVVQGNAGLRAGEQAGGMLTHVQAAEVALAYIIAGWLVAWLLFRRRDAN